MILAAPWVAAVIPAARARRLRLRGRPPLALLNNWPAIGWRTWALKAAATNAVERYGAHGAPFQAAQSQVHFVELDFDPHGAVLAHDPVELSVEEPVQVQVRIQGAPLAAALGETLVGTHADAFVPTDVRDRLQPVDQTRVEFLQSGGRSSGQTPARLKVALQGQKKPFDLPLRSGVIRFGVAQPGPRLAQITRV